MRNFHTQKHLSRVSTRGTIKSQLKQLSPVALVTVENDEKNGVLIKMDYTRNTTIPRKNLGKLKKKVNHLYKYIFLFIYVIF